ncbi:MAG: CBS domain-containing protein [Pseudomonadota bacterium]
MSPISYQGPMEADEGPKHTHSQTAEANLGAGQPGLTVSAILSDKGDDTFTVAPHTSVKEVIAELTRLRVGALVVVDSAKEPVGIVSERDVVRVADAKGADAFAMNVDEIMTPDPKTCYPEDKIEAVMKRMNDGGFRHMPVVEAGKLAGLISIRDVVRHRMLEIEYENLKIKQAIVG